MEKCSICGEMYEGYGNNAYPITMGRCCGVCNDIYVIPARIRHEIEEVGRMGKEVKGK